jgi:hypothetical protein
MGGNDAAFEVPAARRAVGPIAQRHLAVGPDLDASFALLTEDLALEPVELLFEPGDFRAAAPDRQRRAPVAGSMPPLLRGWKGSGSGRWFHAEIIPRKTDTQVHVYKLICEARHFPAAR